MKGDDFEVFIFFSVKQHSLYTEEFKSCIGGVFLEFI